MTTSAKMDDDLGQLTEKILNLTLEIIYLLTGEGYKVVKETSGEPLKPTDSPSEPSLPTDTPPPSLKAEINSKKVLEVTNKIIDLLTGETGSFDDLNIIVKEEDDDEIDDDEWVYIGYKNRFHNVMLKDLPPLTSPDGSRKRNPPETCPRPLDSTLQDHNYLPIPHHDECEEDTEMNFEDSEEEETPAGGELQSMTDDGRMATSKDKETSSSLIADGSRKQKPPETCPRPLDSWNYILEDHNYAKCDQDIEMNSEENEEEETPMVDLPPEKENGIKETMKERGTSLGITTEHEGDVPNTRSNSCTSCEDNNGKDNGATQHSPRGASSTQPSHHTVPDKAPIENRKSDKLKNHEIFSCSECERSFTDKSCYTLHMETHSGETLLQEGHAIPHHDQCANNKDIQTNVNKEDVTPVKGGQQSMNEAGTMTFMKEHQMFSNMTPEQEHDVPDTRRRSCTSYEDNYLPENDTTQHSPGGDSSNQPSHPTVAEKLSADEPTSVKQKNKKILQCSECEKSFTSKSCYTLHMKTHGGQTPLQEDHSVPHHGQCEHNMDTQAEVKKEEVTPVKGGQQSTQEAGMVTTMNARQTSSNNTPEPGHDVPNTRSRCRTSHEDNNAKENGISQHSPGGDSSTQPSHRSVPEKPFVDKPTSVKQKIKKIFSCLKCEKSFTSKSCCTLHMKTHSGQTPLQEDHSIPHHDQCEKVTDVQTEVHKAEETPMRGGQQSLKEGGMTVTIKGKKPSLTITPEHEHDVPNTRSRRTSQENKNTKNNGTTQRSSRGDSSTQPPHPPEKPSFDNSKSDKPRDKNMFSCSECKKSFSSKSRYTLHRKTHSGQRPLHECEEDMQTEVNKEEVTPMRGGLRSLKNSGMVATMKVKRTLNISPEHGHHIPITRKRLRTSYPDCDSKDNGTAQFSPSVDISNQPLHPTVPKNKEEVTPLRGGLKSIKKVGMMETKKVKRSSINITQEHGHDLPNTRRSLRTSHLDYNKEENGTTQRSSEADSLHPTVPKNKEEVTPVRCGLKSMKEVGMMQTKKVKKTSSLTPEDGCDLPYTRRSLRTSHPDYNKKEDGATQHSPEMNSSTQPMHPTVSKNQEGVTPVRGSRQCMKEVGVTVTIKDKKAPLNITPEHEHDAPNTRSRHRTLHPGYDIKGNGTTQHSPGGISTTQPSHSSVTENKEEVTPVRAGHQSMKKVGIMSRMKVRKTSVIITPEHELGIPYTRKSIRTSYPDNNTKENGTTEHSSGTISSTQPLHPTVTEQFLDINKMFFSCSECGKSFTKKLYFAIHMRMHTVDRTIPHHNQGEKNMERKAEVKMEEERPMRSPQQSMKPVGIMAMMKKKKTSITVSPTRGHEALNTRRRSRSSVSDHNPENRGAAQCSPRVDSSPQHLHPTVLKKRYIEKQKSDKHKLNKIFPCPECGKSFSTESYIAIHLRTHTGKRPYACGKCGKSFTYKSSVLRHQRHHSEVRPHPCPLCGKCFKEKSVLRLHLRSHTGERPYPCPECGQRFTQKEHLRRHLRVHRGETPFGCKLCGKCFTRKDMLALHEQRHVNERPFSCPECGNGFTNQFCLARHLRLLHSTKYS